MFEMPLFKLTFVRSFCGYFCFSNFQSKIEMMDSVRILKQLGFTLYASMGTADFYQDHRIDVSGLQCCA